METILVVRIEHPSDEKGFFRSTGNSNDEDVRVCHKHSNYNEISERHTTYNNFPGFYFDDELYDAFTRDNSSEDIKYYNFAYHSLDQLKNGFTLNEIKECIQLGFKVLMYTLDKDYYTSEYQVVFKKKKAINIENITSLFI